MANQVQKVGGLFTGDAGQQCMHLFACTRGSYIMSISAWEQAIRSVKKANAAIKAVHNRRDV
jgi:hypothetical protein